MDNSQKMDPPIFLSEKEETFTIIVIVFTLYSRVTQKGKRTVRLHKIHIPFNIYLES